MRLVTMHLLHDKVDHAAGDVHDFDDRLAFKLRAKITIGAKADQAAVEAAARTEEVIASQLEGKTVVKVVYVPGRMVNFVVK